MTVRQIENRMNKIADLDAKIAELEKERAEVVNAIKEEMKDAEIVKTPRFVIRYAWIVSRRFDSSAFKAAHAKLYDAFTKQTETRRFTYSVNN